MGWHIWKADCVSDLIESRARVTVDDETGEGVIEFIVRGEASLGERIKRAFRYIFRCSSIVTGILIITREDMERLREVLDGALGQDGKGRG